MVLNDKILIQLYNDRVWTGDDESIWYELNVDEPSEIAITDSEDESIQYSKIIANKYGEPGVQSTVSVQITPSSELVEQYPFAVVSIDGKLYDLGVLDNPIDFPMFYNHRISIEWNPGVLVETFRVVYKK